MDKCKVGVVGIGRGSMIWSYCINADNADLVAICDSWEEGIQAMREVNTDKNLALYTDYDEFLKHDMDVVLLANYANEHAPFAIKAMEAGKDVISEVLPCQNMAEAVALIECVERTGRKYCYAENYCYYPCTTEMRNRFRRGDLGDFEYGEGEYMHNCSGGWTPLTRGDRNHWRNICSVFFYCTHSVGPLLYISGMRPKKVVGFEMPLNKRTAMMGLPAGHTAVEMVTLENGAVIKSLHGAACSRNSVWYSIYGSKGRIESAREDTKLDSTSRVYTNLDEVELDNKENPETYLIELSEAAKKAGHGGSDHYMLHAAFDHVCGKESEIVDVYTGIDMWMCGFFAYLSVLNGGGPQEIPDLRDPAVREKYRNDRRCTDPKVAGDQLLPSYSKGNPDIPAEIFDKRHEDWKVQQQWTINTITKMVKEWNEKKK